MQFQTSYWRLLAIPILSALMFRNFSLMHEAVHGLVSKKKDLNNVFGIFSGALCGLPYEPWKQVHLEHHYWSGNVEKDPVMGLMRTYPHWPKALQKTATFCWQCWIPLLAVFQYFIFWWHSSLQFIKNPKSPAIAASLIFPFLFWGSLMMFLPSDFFITIVTPAALIYLVAVEVINFPHHIGLPQYRGDHKIATWNQFEIARSCIYPTWLARYIVLNFNYHIEHHMFPDAPWYHLDKIHLVLKEELNEKYNTDPQFLWILKNRPKPLDKLLLTPAFDVEDQKAA